MALLRFADETTIDAEARRLFAEADEKGAPNANLLRILAHRPEILVEFTRFWWTCFEKGVLDHTLKELVRVRIAELIGCNYCGTVRSALARRIGLSEDRIRATRDVENSDCFSDRERAALQFAEIYVREHERADARLYESMRAYFSEPEIVELAVMVAFLIGFDTLIATWHLDPAACPV